MIAYVRGTLVEKTLMPPSVVVEAGGLGYELFVPLSTFDALPREGEEVRLWAHDHVREDAHLLFGFATPGEKELFLQFQSVSGVGPKLALAALSGLAPDSLRRAVADGDVKILSRISGIGKKTAERIVLELRGKVRPTVVTVDGAANDAASTGALSRACEDAVLALVSLGQTKDAAEKAIRAIPAADLEGRTSGEIVRLALSRT